MRATESYVLLRSSPQQGLFCKGIAPQNLVPRLRCRPTLCSATGALNKTLLRDLVAAKLCQTDQKEYRTMFLAPQPSCCATPCSAKFARQLRCSAEPCSETGALRRTLPGDRVAGRSAHPQLAFLLLRCPATGLLGETLLDNFVLAQECLFRKFCCTTAPYPTPPNRIARPAPENPSGRSVAAQKRRAAGTGPCLFFPTDQFSLFY